MAPQLSKQIRRVVLVGLAAFVLVNGCSWQPGYGGRNDRKPGMEVERYFGWPACFYADLWRSDEPMAVEPWAFAPPMPITRKMYFVYNRFGLLPLLLDAVFVLAGMAVAVALFFKDHGCKVQTVSTPEAVKAWNEAEGKTIAMFHVTC